MVRKLHEANFEDKNEWSYVPTCTNYFGVNTYDTKNIPNILSFPNGRVVLAII